MLASLLSRALGQFGQLLHALHANSYLWLAAYFFNGLVLTIFNKAVMQFLDFNYPWALTAVHSFCSAVGCYLLYLFGAFKPAKLSRRGNHVVLALSVLYTANIGLSNFSLNLVTVPFHQIVRATTPIFVLIINVAWLGYSPSSQIVLSLLPTIFGVGLATYGDYSFTAFGFFWTILGTMSSALKGVVTNQVQVGELKLHPMDLLLRLSPLACVEAVLASYYTGEAAKLQAKFRWTPNVTSILLINGVLAFSMNLVSFYANKKTSALTMGVAGNIKQVLSIITAVVVFSLRISGTNLAGIIVTLCGGFYYSAVDLRMKQQRQQQLQQQQQQASPRERLEIAESSEKGTGTNNSGAASPHFVVKDIAAEAGGAEDTDEQKRLIPSDSA